MLEHVTSLTPFLARNVCSIWNARDLKHTIVACANLICSALNSLADQDLTALAAKPMTKSVARVLPEFTRGLLECSEEIRQSGFLVQVNELLEASIMAIMQSNAAKE